jgi:hypothetical protein
MSMSPLLFLILTLPLAVLTCPIEGVPAPTQPAISIALVLRPTELMISAKGRAFDLRLEHDVLTFCDESGRRALDLKTGRDAGLDRTSCTKSNERSLICASSELDVTVRAPSGEVNDIVDAGGWAFPLEGRFQDCAANGKILAIVTAVVVVLVDAPTRTQLEIGRPGGREVTIGSGWVAWTNGSTVRARAFTEVQ